MQNAVAIEYGRVMEIEAKKKFEYIYNLIIEPVGLCVDEKILYLAESPDGLIGEDSIIGIKCPFSARNFSDIFDAIDAGKIPFCFKDKQNNIQSQLHKIGIIIFYNECLLPELINPQFGKRHLVTDIIDPPRILKEQAAKKYISPTTLKIILLIYYYEHARNYAMNLN
ncbi:YqaJ domain-containing protein [Aphis craccivora]|uniref:YqaJ domain-containing protein n=1 Tax=Aphis craccivora TaxID=307492 RepID=A0A6G0Y034_APHCR|nr:YqaJ domain-containing protein [Aphis craccivora]KAF0746794.1 YqaJ domain-containing protein [Aphis craccivora]